MALAFSLILSGSAYAADETTTQEMTVTYTKQEDPEQSAEPAPSRPVYEISIPSQMSLNEGDTIPLYLIENNLPAGKMLQVYIDGEKTVEADGYLHLAGTKGQTPAKVAIGYYQSNGTAEYINNAGIWCVAEFVSGNIRPISGGVLFMRVTNDTELLADTYTGTVHFRLRTYDE